MQQPGRKDIKEKRAAVTDAELSLEHKDGELSIECSHLMRDERFKRTCG